MNTAKREIRKYNESSIIQGLGLPSGQKLTLGLLPTITLKAVPVSTYAHFPALL
jgi:hypothetical protein